MTIGSPLHNRLRWMSLLVVFVWKFKWIMLPAVRPVRSRHCVAVHLFYILNVCEGLSVGLVLCTCFLFIICSPLPLSLCKEVDRQSAVKFPPQVVIMATNNNTNVFQIFIMECRWS